MLLSLAQFSKHHQVLCVTHLATIAAKGDSNYYIYKENIENRTKTFVAKLDEAAFDEVWLVGEMFEKTAPGYRCFANVDEVKAAIAATPIANRFILIKGSNSTKLFQLPELL